MFLDSLRTDAVITVIILIVIGFGVPGLGRGIRRAVVGHYRRLGHPRLRRIGLIHAAADITAATFGRCV